MKKYLYILGIPLLIILAFWVFNHINPWAAIILIIGLAIFLFEKINKSLK